MGHRKAFLVREDYRLAWWGPGVWMRAARVRVELCKLPSLEGVCIQALQLLHTLALEGSQILDEVQEVQVHTQACLALACIVGELLAEEHSWVLGPEESSWVSEQEEHSWALELSRMVLALEQNMLAWAWVRCTKA